MKESKRIDEQISARCRGKLTEKRIRMNKIAEVLDISDNTIYKKMSGESAFTVGEIYLIAIACNLTRDEVYFIIFGQ